MGIGKRSLRPSSLRPPRRTSSLSTQSIGRSNAQRYAYTPNFASTHGGVEKEQNLIVSGRQVGMHRPSHHGNEFQALMRTRRPRSWRAVSVAGMALALAECSVLAADKRGVWTWTPAVSSTDSKRVQEVCASLPRACVLRRARCIVGGGTVQWGCSWVGSAST